MKIRMRLTALTLVATLASTHSATSGTFCSRIESIARDSAKVDYMKRWIDQKIHTPEFLWRMGRFNIYLRRTIGRPHDFAEVQLDLAFLGMIPENAGVELNRNDDERFMDPRNIRSVSFSQGRDDLVIRINNASDFGRTDYDNDQKGRLKQIGSDVWIWCG